MGKSQRDKGKRGERLAVQILRPAFPNAARDLNDVYAKRGIDLIHTGRLDVQVKHYSGHVPINKYNEIIAGEGRIAVLISIPTHSPDSKPMVVLSAEDFLDILQDVGIVYNE